MNEILKSKEEVMQAFQTLLKEQKKLQAKIATKEEIALEKKEKELVTVASKHTVSSIVKGLANLQLSFGDAVESLSGKLQGELQKLDEIKASIQVEKAHVRELQNTKIAADALHILKQEHEMLFKQFEEETTQQNKQLEEEIVRKQEAWEKSEKEFEAIWLEKRENLQKMREKELADYKYELDKTYKIEADDYQEDKKILERKLEETEQKKEEDWKEREEKLKENQEDFEKYKTKVDAFDDELKEAIQKAKDEAIKDASKTAKIKADLLQKDVEGKRQVYEMQVQTLEETIAKQQTQVEKLQTELKDALAQVQSLSLKAIESGVKNNQ